MEPPLTLRGTVTLGLQAFAGARPGPFGDNIGRGPAGPHDLRRWPPRSSRHNWTNKRRTFQVVKISLSLSIGARGGLAIALVDRHPRHRFRRRQETGMTGDKIPITFRGEAGLRTDSSDR